MSQLLPNSHIRPDLMPYQYYLVEVGRKPYCQEREYVQMELRLPDTPISQPPTRPCKNTQVQESELDACKGGKGKGKKKGKKKKGKKK